MGISIETQSDTWSLDDSRWNASRYGRDVNRSVTLDLSLFLNEHAVNGFIPSGTVLAKMTSTGLYGPYSPGLSNGMQVARGHLFQPTKHAGVGNVTGQVAVALTWQGIVNQDYLPIFGGPALNLGVIDSDARLVLTHIRYEGTDIG